jgi:cardiolipin synthase (CMP-forming)
MAALKMNLNLATCLTWLRIALIPVVVGLYYLPAEWVHLALAEKNTIAMLCFVVAALTDWLDGYVARHYNQSSAFGAFLDPVADKLMVAAALCILMELDRVNAALGFLIIGRELAISALREWMASAGKRASVAVNSLGKFKTIAQMVAIPMLLFDAALPYIPGIHSRQIGTVLLVIAAVLTVVSMVYYFSLANKALKTH